MWKLHPRLELTPGARFDLFRSGGTSAVAADGRLALRSEVNDRVRLVHTLGVTHQPPSFFVPLPGIAQGNLKDGLQTSVQSSAGVEVDLPEATTASVSFFDNVFLNMSDTLSATRGEMPTAGGRIPAGAERRSLGSAYGLEVYIRRRLTRRLGGFLSYTLSRSTRREVKDTFPSALDRTHVLNAALAVDLGLGFRAGARFTLYTGAPVQGSETGETVDALDTSNSPRDPAFYRIDARLEKRWALAHTRWISLVMEMLNTTLHPETVSGQVIGPIAIPSIGVEGGF